MKLSNWKYLPNTLTLFNLLSGGIAATFVAKGDYTGALVLIGLSLVLDLLDGLMARLLNAGSAIGKDLDSLADMVAFGFTPSLLLYNLMVSTGEMGAWLPYLGFTPMLAAAWRLATFNHDPNQTRSFKGLPTPASAAVIMSLPLMEYSTADFISGMLLSSAFLFLMALIPGILMVSPLRLFSLKTSRFDLKPNIHRYLMILLMLCVLVFFWPLVGILFLILYLGISLTFRKLILQEEVPPSK